ncbi:amino acid adenylation domain-containing protein [Cytobacillus sp. NJ13]|nr:amino acid adenylation domain-containing protein [Cytobacillus sp. NJ13]
MAKPEIQKIYPLSPMQEGMLFHALYSKESNAYFEQVRLDIDKVINIQAFEESFNRLIARHDILRSIFIHEGVPRPVQVVLKERHANIHLEKIDHLNSDEQSRFINNYINEEKKRIFQLDKDLLMRITVFATGSNSSVVLWSFHHILLDGWSLGLLWEEFTSIYKEIMTGEPANLPPVQPYSSYISWLEKRDKDSSLHYWRNYLDGYEVQASLPTRNEKEISKDKYDLKWIDIPVDVNMLSRMETIARKLNVTLNNYIQAVWGILLTKYNRTKDVVFGSVLSGRPSEITGIDQMIGLFIQTTPVRVTISDNTSFEDLLLKLQKDALASQEHAFVPLADIQGQSSLGKELLNHLVMFENYPLKSGTDSEMENRLTVSHMEIIEHTNYDFQLLVVPGENFYLRLSYNANVYNQQIMQNVSGHLSNLLEQVTDFPGLAIKELEMLNESEKELIMKVSSGPEVNFRRDIMIHEILQEQAECIPNKTAVKFNDEELTYRQLNDKANQLASVLQKNGLRGGGTVALRLERSLEMIIGIFGILKAGGAYLPIDPDFPQERTNYMLEDSHAGFLLTKSDVEPLMEGFKGQTLFLDDPDLYSGDASNIKSPISPEDLIYIIYTSGSTGKPKGVMIQHDSVMNRLYWMQREYPINKDDVILQKTPFTFDVSVWELFWWTITGSSLCLLAPGGEKDPEILVETINQNNVSILHFVPSMLQAFLNYVDEREESVQKLASVKKCFASGEALLLKQVHKFNELLYSANRTELINLYGPTEATVDVSYYDCGPDGIDDLVPIGKPIDNVQLYIVDAYNHLMPVGVIGELCIAGVGLARGYLNRVDLTREKFVNNPFDFGSKMYRTGDLARWLPNGQIEYLGRMDQQVKVRGYRIELQEIEACLLEHDMVIEAVVTLRRDAMNEDYLSAYVVLKQGHVAESLFQKELKEFLGTKMPAYMVPAHLMVLESMPLTPNGKLDRKSLPEPEVYLNDRYVAPQTVEEQQLAEVWKEILGLKDIGVHDDFFALGGHSLKATILVARLKKIFGKTVPLSEIFEYPTIRELSMRLEQSREEIKKSSLQKASLSAHFPLSSAQRRLFVLSQFEEVGTSYNMPNAMLIEGPIDVLRLKASLQQVVQRHESLRTTFKMHEGHPVQVINDFVDVEIEKISALDKDISLIDSNFVKPFNLEKGPLFRVSLVNLEEDRSLLLFDMHHIISDGISMNLIVKDVLSGYSGQMFEQLPFQYKDYAVWQQEDKNSDAYLKQESYWLNKFDSKPERLELPLLGTRPTIQSFEGRRQNGIIDSVLYKKLNKLAEQTESSLYMIILTAYNILLSKYSGQEDITIGSPVSGRTHDELQKIIGVFVNMLPMRNYPAGSKSFRSFLKEVKNQTLEALEHQDYPFEDLVEKLEIHRDTSRHPLFDVALVHQNMEQSQFTLEKTKVKPYNLPHTTSKFDLTLETTQEEDYISFCWEYKTLIFTAEQINQMSGHFMEILIAAADKPDAPIGQIDVVTDKEKELIRQNFNKLDIGYPEVETIHSLFEKRVEQFPENTAISFAGQKMTYRELNNCANNLAGKLKSAGIGPDKLAIILMDRSPNIIISMLAVLKAGGAYVPIDPSYPKDRIQFIAEDSKAEVIISETPLPEDLEFNGNFVRFDKNDLKGIAPNLSISSRPGHLAYIIYTSGTTGNPKGVMIEHRNVVRLFKNDDQLFDFDESDVWTIFHSCSFDFSVWEIYGALLNGGTCVVVPKETAQNPDLFLNLLESEKVTILNQTPTAFKSLMKHEFRRSVTLSLRYIVFGGEALNPIILKDWHVRYPDVRLINMYGITEITVHATYKEIKMKDIMGDASPIGQPIPTLAISILDKWGRLTPFGVPGELCIAGEGLARGYLNRPELTREKFIDYPCEPGTRLYRSGDLARWLPDGRLEYLGRMDDQVKIRGHRIELGEIEAHLLHLEGIEDALVLAQKDADGQDFLCAYLAGGKALTVSSIRSHLARNLPDYMIPASYVQLDQFPLTVNGKVDKQALPAPDGHMDTGAVYEAPQGDAEERLALVWKEVLRARTIGRYDHFFDLGGDSIKGIQVAARLHERGWKLELKDLFRHPTISELAPYMKKAGGVQSSQEEATGEVILTPIQRWFFDQKFKEAHHWNQSVLLYSPEGFDPEALESSVHALLCHHDALRMAYREEDGMVIQWNRSAEEGALYLWETIRMEETGDELAGRIEQESSRLQAGLNLVDGPLVAGALFQTRQGDHFLLAIHHLAVDGVSWRILLDDLAEGYSQARRSEAIQLPKKTSSFQQWSRELAQYAQSRRVRKEQAYWSEVAKVPVLPLPKDGEAPGNHMADESHVVIQFTKEETDRLLKEASRAYRTDMNDLLLTALLNAAEEWTGNPGLVIDLEGHGRESIGESVDISRTVGWFTTMFPVALSASGAADPGEQIQMVKEQLRRIPNKGMGYGLLAYQNSPDEKPAEYKPEVGFNYLGDFGESAGGEQEWRMSPYSSGASLGPANHRIHALEINGMTLEGKLQFRLSYNRFEYRERSIRTFAESFKRHLKELADYCIAQERSLKTPSDAGYPGLSLEAWKEIQKVYPAELIEAIRPLSPMQEGILFEGLMNPDSPAYFEQLSFVAKGELESVWLRESFQDLAVRHEILRTVFTNEGDQPLQLVLKELPLEVKEVSLLDIDKEDQQEAIDAWKAADIEAGFDLKKGPLMRLQVLQTGEEEFVLIWSHHHILMDGWCLSLLLQEFLSLYAGKRKGLPAELGPVPSYGRYIEWLADQDPDQAKGYWREHLKGYAEKAALPKKQAAVSVPYQQAEVQYSLPASQTRRLEEVARELNSTVSTVLQAAWGVLLSQYSQQDDAVFGTVVSGRPPAVKGVETIVGLFINAIPVRYQPSPDKTFAELVKEGQSAAVSSQENSFLSLADIQGESELGQGLIDHLFVVENYPFDEEAMAKGGAQAGFSIQNEGVFEQTSYDLNVIIVPGEELKYTFRFNPERFEAYTVDLLIEHFTRLINRVITNPKMIVSDIQRLSEAEISSIQSFNKTGEIYKLEQTIVQLFEYQVKQTPENTAVVFGDKKWSYQRLNREANQLARHLQAKGAGAEKIVAVLADQSADMILAVLAVLKAGSAYVPIDPAYPAERIQYMLQDSQAVLAITQQHLTGKVKGSAEQVVLEERGWTGETEENLPQSTAANQLAYVIYTSGTTGYPKGVMVEHRSLSNLCQWHNDQFEVTEKDRSTKLAGFGFDASVWEIFPPLLKGASLYIVPEELRMDIQGINEFFEQNRITISFLPTPLCEPFLALDNQSLRVLLTGGDRLKSYRPSRFQLVNNYGPTENTVVATSGIIGEQKANLPIGYPIANTRVYILGKNSQLQPIGVPGELCIAGESLARGYLNRPELTREKFIDHPCEPGNRLYRTGDLARWLPDGRLEYLGRMDDQVKIRGHRIELGEIEANLLDLEGVEDALVLAQKDADGQDFLCGYLAGGKALTDSAIRSHLSKNLPEYMMPTYFIQLDKFPVTNNGKVNREALREMNVNKESVIAKEPRNPIEEQLMIIWRELLGSDSIGIDDNFFYRGGHSLKAANLAAKVSKEFNVDFPIRSVFENPTLAEMAALITSKDSKKYSGINSADNSNYYPASSAQERLYIISQFDKSSLSYNIPAAFRVKERLKEQNLKEVIHALARRHESLRTSFKLIDGELKQEIYTEGNIELYTDSATKSNLNEKIQEFVMPFDLHQAPLMRVKLLHMEDEDLLLFDIHHIISDGISMDVLIKDFTKLYKGESLAPLSIQYKDYAVWQRRELETERIAKQERYWMEKLNGEIPAVDLPTDFTRPIINKFLGDRYSLTVDKELFNRIKELAHKTNTSVYMVLFSAYSILLSKYTQQEDIIIGSTISGRMHDEIQELIGMFANTLALRVNPKGNLKFTDYLQNAKEVILEAFENQEYPFEKLVEKLNIKRDVSRNAIFDTVFLLRHAEKEVSENSLFRPVPVTNLTSKFDITLEVIDVGESLTFDWEYSTQLFKKGTIQNMAKHLITILEKVIESPEFPLQKINILSKEEKSSLEKFNSTEMEFPMDKRLDQLVEEQAARSPYETALVCGDRRISYQELSRQASAAAASLIRDGIRPGDHVGIIAGRKAETVAGLLGILKAGAAYVPMEPDYPEERIRYIQSQSRLTSVFMDEEACRMLKGKLLPETRVIALEEAVGGIPAEVAVPSDPSSLAYILYTSGSTGKPKGVMIEHRSAVNLIHWVNTTYRVGAGDRLLWLTSMCFDLSVYDLFGVLASGGTVVIAQKEEVQDPIRLREMLKEERITFWDSVPTTLHHLIRSLEESGTSYLQEDLRLVFLSGDWIPVNLKERSEAYLPNARIIGLGGATEGTIWSNYYPIDSVKEGEKSIPYGKPIGNNAFYILDENQRHVPQGAIGELYIGGIGVARGYMGDEEKTKAAFMKDPFRENGMARMYRTGDLGRMLPEGNMEFLGRKDHQVKVRGYRIELGEVEAKLSAHPAVKETVVTVLKDEEGNSGLCAYLVGGKNVSDRELREHLAASLPVYMLPAHYVWLDAMPLSDNGKIDRRSLPNPKKQILEEPFERPESETAQAMAEIWKNLLGVERVGLHDDFFTLGGQSLKAASLTTQIFKKWDIEVPLQWVFQYPTLESFSNQIDNLLKSGFPKETPVVKLKDGEYQLFCFPPVSGFGSEYKGLSLHLDEWAVYGFDFIKEENRISQYLSIIKDIQPQGPYTLLGYSAGGNLAYEVARSLEEAGEKVSKVIIIDAERKNQAGVASIEQITNDTKEQLASVREKYREYLSVPTLFQAAENRIRQYRIYLNNSKNDGQINADIYAFRSTETSELGWESLTAGSYEEIQGYGKHAEMLDDPYIHKNLKQIKAILPMNNKLLPETIG